MTVPDGKTEGSRCNVDEIFWTMQQNCWKKVLNTTAVW